MSRNPPGGCGVDTDDSSTTLAGGWFISPVAYASSTQRLFSPSMKRWVNRERIVRRSIVLKGLFSMGGR